MNEYKLSASLKGHEDDVRGVAFPFPDLIVSASRDATVRIWKPLSHVLQQYDDTVVSSGSTFVNTVAYVRPTKQYGDGLIVSGGKDTIIEVREPNKMPNQQAERLLVGHSNAVCALDVDQEGTYLVSGSWDGTARIWSTDSWECTKILEGHEGSVLGVLAYDKDTIVTAAADKFIRVFRKDGKLVGKIKGHNDVVRAVCKLPEGHDSGANFVSAGNDGVIKFWKLDGSEVASLHGHESFVYSIALLPNGEIASTGEDRTLRIWKGTQCVQTITHPAISVWAIAVCRENGDIVTGASDKRARVFTRSKERQADAQELLAFDESVRGSAIPQQQVGNINKEQLPGPEFLREKVGKRDGQVSMVRESDGSIGAYSWSSSTHEWIQVGTVVDAVGSSGRKQTYHGKDYDFVFDVDIEDGKPPLKLPYNLTQNPYEAATKFINDNELSMNYLDEVAGFITSNTQGASIGQPAQEKAQSVGDPWGTENRYRPNEGSSSQSRKSFDNTRSNILPQKQYLSIRTANLKMITKKIEDLNATVGSSSSLNAKQLETLRSLASTIENTSESDTLPASVVQPGLEILLSTLKSWTQASYLPILDFLRVLAASSSEIAKYEEVSTGDDIISILSKSGAVGDKERPNNSMLAIRLLANLFESQAGRDLVDRRFSQILELVKSVTLHKGNRNLVIAIATLYINYSVFLTSDDIKGRVDSFDRSSASFEILINILKTEKDSEATYRALVGAGTLLEVSDEIKEAAKDVYGIQDVLKRVHALAKEPRFKSVVAEIEALLADVRE